MTTALRVVATAGHVDHGKSSLIVRLTGIDPDRWAEEKRRGLTIDLGYAWTVLPCGREIGFVDVPGHERFIRNMLAGVGPVRLVLFVVAADEGWARQSEEHLQILDVLGVEGAVVALTKRDLVDDETLALAREEVRERLAGTALEGAPVIAVSARTGEGMETLTGALDTMVGAAPAPPPSRARLSVDRVFTITGAGTVVTGTLGGDALRAGDEVVLEPGAVRARIRSLQTHEREVAVAEPVSRVAANLVGVEKASATRGNVLVRPGAWAPTRTLDVWVRPVRGRTRIPGRGAFTVHAGAAETAARLQLGAAEGEGTLARLRTTHAMVLEPGDRFVIREEGRAATVGGGVVLDVAPPRAFARRAHQGFLARRLAARDRATMASLLVEERGAVRADQVPVATGADAPSASVLGGWAVADHLSTSVAADLAAELGDFHLAHPLEEGMPLAVARGRVAGTLRAARVRPADDLIDALVDAAPGVVRTAVTVRLATHAVDLGTSGEDIARLLDAIGGDRMASPPGVGDLVADGFARELIDAASRADQVIRLAPDLVVHPALVDRARDVAAAHPEGLTVSALREALGTSRKFAVPLVEWMDAHGLTRREGDLRFLR